MPQISTIINNQANSGEFGDNNSVLESEDNNNDS